MNKADAILDYIFELSARVSDLCSPDAPEIFNKPAHGLKENEIICTLQDLYHSNMVEFFRIHKHGKEFIEEIKDHESCWVSLTVLGGARWENIFQVNWEDYVLVECEFLQDNVNVKTEIWSADLDLLSNAIYKISSQTQIYLISEVKIQSPWYPVYWKKMPIGYMQSFNLIDSEIDSLSILQDKNWRLNWNVLDGDFFLLPGDA